MNPFEFDDNPASSGQTIQTACFVSEGDLPLEIHWELNGKLLENTHLVTIGKIGKKNSILAMDNISYENSGNYSCTATNRAGKDSYTTSLMVNG